MGAATQSTNDAKIFTDVSQALDQLTETKRALDRANAEVVHHEGMLDTAREVPAGREKTNAIEAAKELISRSRVRVERARERYEVCFAIYQEAARARDVAKSNEYAAASLEAARASQNAADAMTKFTLWITFATIVSALLGFASFVKSCT